MKILGLFSHWKWFLDTQNGFCVIVKGLKNGFFRHYLLFLFASGDDATRIYAQPKMVKNGNFFAKIRFRPYTFIIRGLDFFFFNFADRMRGGGGGGQPIRSGWPKIGRFFLRLPKVFFPNFQCFSEFFPRSWVRTFFLGLTSIFSNFESIFSIFFLFFQIFLFFLIFNFFLSYFQNFSKYYSEFSVFFLFFQSIFPNFSPNLSEDLFFRSH